MWSSETSADAVFVASTSVEEWTVQCGSLWYEGNPSDVGTKTLEEVAKSRCTNKLAIVLAATLRGAIVAALVLVDGCCSQRV